MSGLAFSHPGRLWALALVGVLLLAYVLQQRRRSRYAVRLPGLDLLAAIAPRLGWRRHLAAALMLLALAGTTAAFAGPTANHQVPRERATIIVAIDVSLSMAATDVAPSRLAAAKTAAARFVTQLPARFNVGLISFSGSVSLVVPPTTDHGAVVSAIRGLGLGSSTAIGEAVLTSVQAIRDTPPDGAGPVPAHVVLLSDGGNTVGRPIAAGIAQARAAGVPVSTIAYGTPDGVLQLGGSLIPVPVPVDGPALAELAAQTGGKSYRAATGDELSAVYRDIGSSIGSDTVRGDVSAAAAGIALLLAAATAAGALALRPRLA